MTSIIERPCWGSPPAPLAGLLLATAAVAQHKEMVIGDQCDRTGPTADRRHRAVPGDAGLYTSWSTPRAASTAARSSGDEIDNEYKVPPAIEAYERAEAEGAVIDDALRHAADRGAQPEARARTRSRRPRRASASPPPPTARAFLICSRSPRPTGRRPRRRSSSPRTSSAATSRARRSPMSFTTTRPARSRCRSSTTCRRSEGFELRTFAVPPPGVEMGAQVLDITQRYHARFRHHASVRPLALGGDQGAQGRRLPAAAR